jgi:hypothetical protein
MDPKPTASGSKSAEAQRNLEPAAKKRKRTAADGANPASAAKKAAPSRKRKKQEVPLIGGMTAGSSGSLLSVGSIFIDVNMCI